MFDLDSNDHLSHYGIPGMKWDASKRVHDDSYYLPKMQTHTNTLSPQGSSNKRTPSSVSRGSVSNAKSTTSKYSDRPAREARKTVYLKRRIGAKELAARLKGAAYGNMNADIAKNDTRSAQVVGSAKLHKYATKDDVRKANRRSDDAYRERLHKYHIRKAKEREENRRKDKSIAEWNTRDRARAVKEAEKDPRAKFLEDGSIFFGRGDPRNHGPKSNSKNKLTYSKGGRSLKPNRGTRRSGSGSRSSRNSDDAIARRNTRDRNRALKIHRKTGEGKLLEDGSIFFGSGDPRNHGPKRDSKGRLNYR